MNDVAAADERASVLIVEDEAVVALDLKGELESLGYRVVGIADTADGAVALARRLRPAVTLMDIQLKGDGDGVCAAESLQRESLGPVIFMTSFSDEATVQRAARASAYGYLTKPFQIKEVRAGIEVAMWKSRMERRLREADRWFALTLRCVQDGVVVVDGGGAIRFMNSAAERLTGWLRSEAEGRDVGRVVCFEAGDAAAGAELPTSVLQALQAGRVVGVRHARRLLTRQGTVAMVDESAGPIHDDDGRPVGGVLVLRDAADRLRQQAELQDSERRFRGVFEAAPLGMALVSTEGEFLQVNEAMCALLRRPAEQLLRQSQVALTHPDDRAHEAERLHELSAAQRPASRSVTPFEKRYLRTGTTGPADAEPVWVLVNASLIDGDDAPACWLYQVHDLTAQKAAAEQLAGLAAERLGRETGDLARRGSGAFLSRVSHEMRTPLNAVLGFAELLKQRHASEAPQVGAYSEYILTAGRHLLALVDDVLDLQRASEGTLRVDMTAVSLDDELPASIGLLETTAEDRRIRLLTAIAPGLRVAADPTRLRQIMLNIGSNAIKYNVGGGSVLFRAAPLPGGRIGIAVEDSGIGLSPEQLEHLFEPFNRLGRESLQVPGIGLGLVITRQLVERMGGTIAVASEPGSGTVVSLEFAAAPAPDTSASGRD